MGYLTLQRRSCTIYGSISSKPKGEYQKSDRAYGRVRDSYLLMMIEDGLRSRPLDEEISIRKEKGRPLAGWCSLPFFAGSAYRKTDWNCGWGGRHFLRAGTLSLSDNKNKPKHQRKKTPHSPPKPFTRPTRQTRQGPNKEKTGPALWGELPPFSKFVPSTPVLS